MLSVIAPSAAHAVEYEIFIDVETEEDLYDLQITAQISDETFETLRELYQRGVDLNTASREELYTLPNLTYAEVDAILKYRDEAGFIRDPADLVINNIISEDKLGAMAVFLVVRDRTGSLLSAEGYLRTQSRWTAEDDRLPPFALQSRLDTLKNLRIGVAATVTRNRLGEVAYDPNRNALSARSAEAQAHVPKAYAFWDTDDVSVIAGTYRIGFGQKLTFDITDQVSPNGIYPDDELFRSTDLTSECKESTGELGMTPCPRGGAGSVFVTPDFRWRDALLGFAVGLKQLPIGPGKLQTYGFFSYQPKSIYQYELYDRGICSDPRDDGNSNCSAPDVFVTRDDLFEPTAEVSFQTLPNMYAEMTAGGNVTYKHNRRTHLGVTGYGSNPDFLTEGIDLDFQEWSRRPFGGPWGAVGVDAAYGLDKFDFFAEVARSFDKQLGGDGGGMAAIFRSVTSWNKNEIEGSLRYYSDEFANPYARPISAPDQFDGLRARDELGARIRYNARFAKKVTLRTSADLWTNPTEDTAKGLFYVRSDADVTDQWRVGGWVTYQNKGFDRSGRAQCFEISTEDDENGEPIPCSGHKIQLTPVRVRYAPTRQYDVSVQYVYELLDDELYNDRYRRDHNLTAIFTAKPLDGVRLRARGRYLAEDTSTKQFFAALVPIPSDSTGPGSQLVNDMGSFEQSFWVYLEVAYKLRLRDRLRVRYDWFKTVDNRPATLSRNPNPEHWLWLEYQAKF